MKARSSESTSKLIFFIIPPANFVCGGYTVFTLSVCVCVRPCVRASVCACVNLDNYSLIWLLYMHG